MAQVPARQASAANSGAAEIWVFAVCTIALHAAIGYAIGSPWAVALALTPGLTLIPAGGGEWVPFVIFPWGVPIAASIGGA